MERLKSILPLNFSLLGNPINWAIIWLMVAIAGLGLAYVMQSAGRNTSNGAT